jgi:beta-phosphoglucomutase-like phosphatase (HAD superfamily)
MIEAIIFDLDGTLVQTEKLRCIAVSTPFTRNILHTETLLEER